MDCHPPKNGQNGEKRGRKHAALNEPLKRWKRKMSFSLFLSLRYVDLPHFLVLSSAELLH